jgi:hypothetical protein
VHQPPQHGVGVEQQPHDRLERGNEMPNSSLNFPSAASRSSGSIGASTASADAVQPGHVPGLRGYGSCACRNRCHRRLAERARREGVSLNTLAVTLLAEGLGERAARGD